MQLLHFGVGWDFWHLNLHGVNKVQFYFQVGIITIHHKGKNVANGMANVGFQPQP
jgi:hypothetical protein